MYLDLVAHRIRPSQAAMAQRLMAQRFPMAAVARGRLCRPIWPTEEILPA
jgi:hypothetical protein